MIVFENKGEINQLLITTFGISAKEVENPIGYFGTGLKYAIAIILRNGGDIVINSGLDIYEFRTERVKIRNTEADIIYMNDQALSFTLDLGKNWEMWQAVRELYCNSKDEREGKSYHCENGAEPPPEKGVTRIMVWQKEFEEEFFARNKFILMSPPIFCGEYGQIHPGQSDRIFYRGIAVNSYVEGTKSVFTHNITREQKLTEDRSLYSTHNAKVAIASTLINCTDRDIIKECLKADKDEWYEGNIDYRYALGFPSHTFKEVVLECLDNNERDINSSALEAIGMKKEVQHDHMKEFVPNTTQAVSLSKAIQFCKGIGEEVDEYPIVCVKKLGGGILAEAFDGKIWLSEQTLDMGTKQIVNSLLHEYMHVKYDFEDYTPAFQDHLINKWISMAERMRGESL